MALGFFDQPICGFGNMECGGVQDSECCCGIYDFSRIHELCSRTMFFGMLMVATVIMLALAASRATRLWAGTYVAYGLVCVYGF